MDVNNIYLLESKKMPWGDWGDMLWTGITSRDPVSNLVSIERTGPFSPLLYLSNNDFIFTNEARSLYDESSLLGIKFLYEIEKKRVIKLDWHNWDDKQHITNYLDIDGEPEDIILRGINDNELMGNMPVYWLAGIHSNIHLFVDRKSKSKNPSDYIFIDGEASHSDFFIGVERMGVYITKKAKDWIESNFPDHFVYYLIHKKQ
ncbi:Uncharacterised protein [Pragia fontium]|uniref:hypothetical protein n=1 Tax=Pragia fontium TaxID=82985 RepID=UPI000E068929|nr:hypothetical protein [Pragia fontium]SUB83780.1 Uncharacterised protein [Pragia fontium]